MKKKWVLFIILFFLTLGIIYILIFSFRGLKNEAIKKNSDGNLLLPFYSLSKLPDIIFLPYLLTKNNLTEIKIEMSKNDINFLNENLSQTSSAINSNSSEKNIYRKVNFKSGNDYEAKVDIRYIRTADNGGNYKKSYEIIFPKKNRFHDIKSIQLIDSSATEYYSDFLNQYRAKKLGILTPHMYLASVNLNNKNIGVYLVFEGWTTELTDADKISDETQIFGVNQNKENLFKNEENKNEITDTDINSWKNYTTNKKSEEDIENFDELKTLLSILKDADDKEFEKLIPGIIDMNKFYNWNIFYILAEKKYQSNFPQNFIMAYDPELGKFQPLVLTGIKPQSDQDYYKFDTLSKKILSIEKFRNERNRLLAEYLKNEKNFKDDMDFYDNLYSKTRNDFFRDLSKTYNNFSFLKKVRNQRRDFIDAYKNAKDVLNNIYPSYYKDKDKNNKIALYGTFANLNKEFLTKEEFLAENYQFSSGKNNEIIIFPGVHRFSKAVIVPEGLKVIIKPGATLYMAEKISFLSYSPIIAEGTAENTIKILPQNPSFSWGVFATVNVKEKNIIKFAEFKGGGVGEKFKTNAGRVKGGDIINGITITGMVAFHNTDVVIENSIFEDSLSDDSLNTKSGKIILRNSIFKNNSTDGIDADAITSGSIIENNEFYDNGYKEGGDGIDLSWSNVIIQNNHIRGMTDKGISVGENSDVVIKNNIIENSDIGIAVKDLSNAVVNGGVLKNNRIGITLYKKKEAFGGGKATLSNVNFQNNKEDFKVDSASKLNLE